MLPSFKYVHENVLGNNQYCHAFAMGHCYYDITEEDLRRVQ